LWLFFKVLRFLVVVLIASFATELLQFVLSHVDWYDLKIDLLLFVAMCLFVEFWVIGRSDQHAGSS
jgi:hypothetical protein